MVTQCQWNVLYFKGDIGGGIYFVSLCASLLVPYQFNIFIMSTNTPVPF